MRNSDICVLRRLRTFSLCPKMMLIILFSALICNTLSSSSMKEGEDILLHENPQNLKHSLLQSKAFQKTLFETKSFETLKSEFTNDYEERKRKEQVNTFIP